MSEGKQDHGFAAVINKTVNLLTGTHEKLAKYEDKEFDEIFQNVEAAKKVYYPWLVETLKLTLIRADHEDILLHLKKACPQLILYETRARRVDKERLASERKIRTSSKK